MKAYLLTVLLMVSLNVLSYADSFQFYYKTGNSSVYAAYQSVKLYTTDNKLAFSGFTDKFGRIAIRLRPGTYNCTVMYQKKEYKLIVTLDNRSDFKMAYFGSAIRPYITKKV
jgi:hypothetical protein